MNALSRIRSVGLLALAALLMLAASCRSSGAEKTGAATATGGARATAAAQATEDANAPLRASDVGVTETEIVLGQHTGRSGAYASYWPISQGMQAYFDYWNTEKGGVHGRKIRFVVKDDQTNPAVARTVVQELIEKDKVFAFTGNLGTPQHSAVADLINAQKIPDLWVFTGAGKWNDPQNLPYTFGWTFSYPTESKVLSEYAKKNWPGKKIGIFYQNDDFGKDYQKVFGQDVRTGQGALQVVAEQSYETTASDISSQMQALKNAGAEVVALFSVPKFTILAFKFMRESGWRPLVIMSSVSADPSVIEGAGADLIEGTITAAYLPDISDDSNPDVQEHKRLMAKYAPGVTPSNFTLSGWAQAQLTVETLIRAGRNPTRESLVRAAESIKDFKGIAYGPYNTTKYDHHPLHCQRPTKVEGGKFVQFGDLICAPVKDKP
jgi:branched-chain amino acid transport system substrate-binding protein